MCLTYLISSNLGKRYMCLKLSIAINGRSCKEIKEIDIIIIIEND